MYHTPDSKGLEDWTRFIEIYLMKESLCSRVIHKTCLSWETAIVKYSGSTSMFGYTLHALAP